MSGINSMPDLRAGFAVPSDVSGIAVNVGRATVLSLPDISVSDDGMATTKPPTH